MATTDVPSTISPPLLYSTNIPQTVAALPFATTTQPSVQTSPGTVRSLKRYVRPRAKDEAEQHSRAEERKIANRTAAKASRERQKQAMEAAQQENDLLKAENNALLERLASLEQRVQTMEQNKPKNTNSGKGEGVAEGRVVTQGRGMEEQTYQPARPIMLDQQCPVPLLPSHLNLATVVYALQMLMHSFALSMVLKAHLERRGMGGRMRGLSVRRPAVVRGMKANTYSPWILRFPGDATPNSLNLSGALSNEASRRMNVKSSINPTVVRQTSKDFLHRVRRDRRRGGKACIRLIVKKKPSSSEKRINRK